LFPDSSLGYHSAKEGTNVKKLCSKYVDVGNIKIAKKGKIRFTSLGNIP